MTHWCQPNKEAKEMRNLKNVLSNKREIKSRNKIKYLYFKKKLNDLKEEIRDLCLKI